MKLYKSVDPIQVHKYLETDNGKAILKKHKLSDVGIWRVFNFNGHIMYASGPLINVIWEAIHTEYKYNVLFEKLVVINVR